MNRTKTILFINPGDRHQVYQTLGTDHAAVEPPVWLAQLAAFVRKQGWEAMVIDANAEQMSPEDVAIRTKGIGPLLAVVVVGGSQPSASTQNMPSAGQICRELRVHTDAKVAMSGLHPSALPQRTMSEESVDFVIDGEGPLTLLGLAETLLNGSHDYAGIPGLWLREGGTIRGNRRAQLAENLAFLPQPAWDLLPMQLYRAHNWHCFDHIDSRTPYASIFTSLGCPYSCLFCCINAPFGKPGIRFRSPQVVAEEIGMLVDRHGVRNLKIMDELFVLKESHYMTLVELLLKKGYGLNIWAYARVDTVKAENLAKMKKAGINWLALGIESANPDVRDGAQKRMRVKDVKAVVKAIQGAGIRVIGNFIFGLPEDTCETMQETLDMAVDLKCEFANFYCAMAYPGSGLYDVALEARWPLPDAWDGYSQHSYETRPLPTRYISAREVLAFRDNAFHNYFQNPDYLNMIEQKFGPEVRTHVGEMTATRLKRNLLDHEGRPDA
jgi:anaerobic magnesium-protoporphyrin IX monomethyl ester cyclase